MSKNEIFLDIHSGNNNIDPNNYGYKASRLGFMASHQSINVPPGFMMPMRLTSNLTLPDFVEFIRDDLEERLMPLLQDYTLISVRSGAAETLPGLMLSMLNVGWSASYLDGVLSNNQMFRNLFVSFLEEYCREVNNIDIFTTIASYLASSDATKSSDYAWSVEEIKEILNQYQTIARKPFPFELVDQIIAVSIAVVKSWDKPSANAFRKAFGYRSRPGTGLIFQAMVYGNKSEHSGSGVFHTKPLTGRNNYYVEFTPQKQGIELVLGRTKPSSESFEDNFPDVFRELRQIGNFLERELGAPQEIEFTVQDNDLWILQTRDIDKQEKRISTGSSLRGINTPRHSYFDHREQQKADKQGRKLATGIPAGIGVLSGKLAFDLQGARRIKEQNNDTVILVRPTTSPDDIEAILVADGLLTKYGGATSHAAVAARRFGKVCVVGVLEIEINLERRTLSAHGMELREGDFISLDGVSGLVYEGELKISKDSI